MAHRVRPYETQIGPESLCSSVFRIKHPSRPGAVEIACRGTLTAEAPTCLEEPRPFLPPLTSEKSWSVTLVSSHLRLNHCRACLKHTPGPHTLSLTNLFSAWELPAQGLRWLCCNGGQPLTSAREGKSEGKKVDEEHTLHRAESQGGRQHRRLLRSLWSL